MNILSKKDYVYSQLKDSINAGTYKDGDKLPGYIELSGKFSVAHLTARAALKRLVSEGYAISVNGRGTFVSAEALNPVVRKKILVIMSSKKSFDLPENYYVPAFEKRCYEKGVEFEEMNISFLLQNSPGKIISDLLKNNYTAVLLNSSYFTGSEKIIEILKGLNIPVLIPHTRKEDSTVTGFSSMRLNEKAAWKSAVEYLSSLGHKKISFVVEGCEKDIRGYTAEEHNKMLLSLGCITDDRLMAFVPYQENLVKKAVRKMLKTAQPTAILCSSDFIAIYAYDAIKSLSLKIPSDISVMGFCGYPGGHLMKPSLTTVDLGYGKIGIKAADLLINSDKWYRKGACVEELTEYKIVERASTAAFRGD